ncbi:MAG: hypothetical protein JWN28_609 [Candidatus Saccharibacteria bacterium]|nr:hypothetical protein [Candidatus Saccharibacteria bacterium]
MADKVKPEDLTLHPRGRSPRYGSLGGLDFPFILIVGSGFYIGSDLAAGPMRSWVTILGAVGLLFSLIRLGRYNRRLYMMPSFLTANYWLRRIRHNRLWTQQPTTTQTVEIAKKDVSSAQSILPIRTVRFGDLGLVVNEKYKMVSFAVKISGTNITTKTISEQQAFNVKLSKALTFAFATVRRSNPWIGMIYRSRPDNPYEYEKILLDIVDDRTLVPQGETKPLAEWDENDYINAFVHQVVVQEGLETIETLVEPEMVFMFTVKYSKHFGNVLAEAQKAKSKTEVKFSYRDLQKEPFHRLQQAIVPLLSDVMTGELSVMNFDEMVMYLRKAHDLDISRYYLEAYLAEQRGESLSSTSWMPVGYIDEYKDKVDVNGSWSATIYPTSFPDEFAFPFTGRAFYTPRTLHYTAATIGKITKGDHRYRFIQGKSDMSAGAKDFFGITSSGPRAHQAERDAYNTMAQLDKSGWAVTYQPMLTVSKPTERELEETLNEVTAQLDGLFFEPQRVLGESVQWEEFFTASTGIPLHF